MSWGSNATAPPTTTRPPPATASASRSWRVGWTISRVWSTDWSRNPDGQVERILIAYQRAKAEINQPRSLHRSPEPDEPEPPPIDSPGPVAGPRTPPLASPSYRNIDEVPDAAIQERILGSLRQFGSTEEADLAKGVAHQLGFKRTGDRIRAKIGEYVEALIREGKVGREDGRLQAAAPRANVS